MSWPKSCSRRGRLRMPWRGVGAAAAMVVHAAAAASSGGGVKHGHTPLAWLSFLGCATVARRFLGSVSCRDCPSASAYFESRSFAPRSCEKAAGRAKRCELARVAKASNPALWHATRRESSHLTTAAGGQSVRGGLLLELFGASAAPGRSAVRVP